MEDEKVRNSSNYGFCKTSFLIQIYRVLFIRSNGIVERK